MFSLIDWLSFEDRDEGGGNVQIQLALYRCDPFLINNRKMTGNSVEKCFAVLNVKSEVKLRLKTFY